MKMNNYSRSSIKIIVTVLKFAWGGSEKLYKLNKFWVETWSMSKICQAVKECGKTCMKRRRRPGKSTLTLKTK